MPFGFLLGVEFYGRDHRGNPVSYQQFLSLPNTPFTYRRSSAARRSDNLLRAVRHSSAHRSVIDRRPRRKVGGHPVIGKSELDASRRGGRAQSKTSQTGAASRSTGDDCRRKTLVSPRRTNGIFSAVGGFCVWRRFRNYVDPAVLGDSALQLVADKSATFGHPLGIVV